MQPWIPGQPEWGQMPPVGHPGWDQPHRQWSPGTGRYRRRRRGLGLGAVFIRLEVLIAGIILGGVSAYGAIYGYDASTGKPFPDSEPSVSVPPPTHQTMTASFDSTITLTGSAGDGQKVAITADRVISSATTSDILGPGDGYRLYVVRFHLVNTGSVPYVDTPSLDAAVLDSAGHSYGDSLVDSVNGCPLISDTVNLQPGSSTIGCIAFDVPATARITTIAYVATDGLDTDTARWTIAG